MFFFEEPIFENVDPYLKSEVCPKTGVVVNTPVLPGGLDAEQTVHIQQRLLAEMFQQQAITQYVLWYYTPMSRSFASWLEPMAIVYDCMDELSAFRGAPIDMRRQEAELFQEAELVFTGGATLFESKKSQHPSVHCFPSSIDFDHFAKARTMSEEPADQRGIPQPRIGYAGVIDERMDLDLLREVAVARPDWQLVLLGPVVKIDAASLPQAPNIHYLGMKAYSDLPSYFSGWEIGMLPFALNESTRFISPTKTPEYLAAGLRVISTPIRDVVRPYGNLGLVGIAEDAQEFVRTADLMLGSSSNDEFRAKVDKYLLQSSWEKTWSDMNQLIKNAIVQKQAAAKSLPLRKRALSVAAEGAVHV